MTTSADIPITVFHDHISGYFYHCLSSPHQRIFPSLSLMTTSADISISVSHDYIRGYSHHCLSWPHQRIFPSLSLMTTSPDIPIAVSHEHDHISGLHHCLSSPHQRIFPSLFLKSSSHQRISISLLPEVSSGNISIALPWKPRQLHHMLCCKVIVYHRKIQAGSSKIAVKSIEIKVDAVS